MAVQTTSLCQLFKRLVFGLCPHHAINNPYSPSGYADKGLRLCFAFLELAFKIFSEYGMPCFTVGIYLHQLDCKKVEYCVQNPVALSAALVFALSGRAEIDRSNAAVFKVAVKAS